MLENEGAAPGYDEICAVIEERLIPVFELVGQRLQGLEESNAELKDTLFKIVSGFGDAVHEHKRGGFSEMLGSKFGPDMEELKGPYSDIYGKDLAGELVDKLMGGELGEDGIPDYIGGIRAKFGRIRAPNIEGEITVETPEPAKEPEAPAPIKAEEEKEDIPAGIGGDVLKSMTNVLKQGPTFLKGRRK